MDSTKTEKRSTFVTVSDVEIDSMWPLCKGSFVYEGCIGLLSDGRVCALGKNKRKLRQQDPSSPMGPHSRQRDGHECSKDGAGAYMYCFALQVGDVTIQVNEDAGKKLVGMSGAQFKAEVEGKSAMVQQVQRKMFEGRWTITYVKDYTDGCKAVDFEREKNADTRKEKHCTSAKGKKEIVGPSYRQCRKVSVMVEVEDVVPEAEPFSAEDGSSQLILRSLQKRLLELTEDIADSLKSASLEDKK